MSAQNLVSQGYGGYQGWGDAEAEADFKATGGQGKWTGGSSGSSGGSSNIDPLAVAKQYQQFQSEANKPVIESLQASVPEIKGIYENQINYLKSQQDPLQQRYDAAIKSITDKYNLETTQEFGRRGISTQSGMFDQTLNNRLTPQLSNLNIARETDLKDLLNMISQTTGQETTSLRDIANKIAEVQAGSSSGALDYALQVKNLAQNQSQFEAGQKLKQQELNKPDYSTVTAGGRVLMIDNNGNVVKDLGSSTAGSETDPVTQSLLMQLLGGGTGQNGSDWEDITGNQGVTIGGPTSTLDWNKAQNSGGLTF